MFKKAIFLSLSICFCFVGYAQISYGDYRVWIDVTGNNFSHNSQIYFDDQSWDPLNPPSYSWDECCDANLLGVSVGHVRPFIFTEVVEPPAPPTNHMLSANALPLLFEQIDVPLGFLPGTLAPYTFSFTDLYTLPQGVGIELIDLAQNVTQDLLADSTYDTWGAPSDDEARFIVRFFPSNVTSVSSGGQEQLNVIIDRNQVLISGFKSLDNQVGVSCFNVLGSEVIGETKYQNTGQAALDVSNLSPGIYVVLITDNSGKRLYRKFYYQ
jgi:hypothetical protein